MRALNAENSASNSTKQNATQSSEEEKATSATAFASSGFASYSSNPFSVAASVKPSGFGAVSAASSSASLAPASSEAFTSSGFSSMASSNPFQAALAAAGNRGSKPLGFGFGAPIPSASNPASETASNTEPPPPSPASTLSPSTAPSSDPPAATTSSSSSPPPSAPPPAASSEISSEIDTSRAPLSPPPPPQVNGEEEEECILQLRVKSFKLTTLKDIEKATSQEDGSEDAAPTASAKSPPKVGEWKEMGIGPIRCLVPISSSASCTVRLVQRRETTPGGQGTKVLLNATVGQCDLTGTEAAAAQPAAAADDESATGKVYKPEGKFCRVSLLHKAEEDENPSVVNYLLKFKSEQGEEGG